MGSVFLFKISVIIPVYNVENYLSECLDSIINQSLNDIEIICINDGSTDNSLKILQDYEKRDNRIRVINQKNSGLGATRNVGLSLSEGKYVYFMDSDDYLELSTLEELYHLAETNSLDIVLFKLINFYDETGEKFPTPYYDMTFLRDRVQSNVFNYEDVKDFIFEIAVSAPGKLFKKSLISDMRFPENIIFEDNPFFIEAILKANRAYFYDKYLYYRRIRKNSITSSQFSNYSDAIPILNMIIDKVKDSGHFEELAKDVYQRKVNQCIFRYGLLDEEYKSDFFNVMKKDFSLHKLEYESDDAFGGINPRLKHAFYSCIESDSYKEFDLYLEIFNYKNEISELKRDNNNLSNKCSNLSNEISVLNNNQVNEKYDLSNEISELKNLNKKLIFDNIKLKNSNGFYRNENYKLVKENNHIKSTKIYKLWIKYFNMKK